MLIEKNHINSLGDVEKYIYIILDKMDKFLIFIRFIRNDLKCVFGVRKPLESIKTFFRQLLLENSKIHSEKLLKSATKLGFKIHKKVCNFCIVKEI